MPHPTVRNHGLSLGICLCILTVTKCAFTQGTKADYERALSYDERTRDKVHRLRVEPNWISGGPAFWYRIDIGAGNHEFVLVTPSESSRQPAFDHQKLADALSEHASATIAANKLPFRAISFAQDRTGVRFKALGSSWDWDLAIHELTKVPEADDAARGEVATARVINRLRRSGQSAVETSVRFVNETDGPVKLFWIDASRQRRPYGTIPSRTDHNQHTFAGHVWLVTDNEDKPLAAFEAIKENSVAIIDGTGQVEIPQRFRRDRSRRQASPDGRWEAFIENHNVHVREVTTGETFALSDGGREEDPFHARFHWSPDSARLVALQIRPGEERKVRLIESSPADQLQPRLHEHNYAKPGDEMPLPRPRMFDVEGREMIDFSDELFSNPWSISNLRWSADSQRFDFLYNQRGHQVLRIIAVDATSGEAHAIIDEQSTTFIDYAYKEFTHYIEETDEIVWMSERDGHNHLYLYDINTGAVKNQITRGEWVVRGVERVDGKNRQIWFSVGGIYPDQDPYYVHLCRINFDGTDLTILTKGNGTHKWRFSPDRDYILDTWSRVDHPPVTELRLASDGSLVCVLETADWDELIATGWRPPERFVAKARDGESDIHGIIVRPTNIAPDAEYPVIEKIYAGPQGAFVPKSFGRARDVAALAELGFIVVQIDGMGTSHRSKAFHDICWHNLGDAGFPDRIAWMKAAAARYPQIDLTRVGIYGGSAGGQNALRALLAHGDFYKVGAADCGCHDNRMDKIWWNELWMGWPIGPHYEEQSNVTQAHRLTGKLLLTVGELDRNVDPASTMQVVNALIKADKDFDMIVVPGGGHGIGERPYGRRRRMDFFVRHLHGVEPRRQERIATSGFVTTQVGTQQAGSSATEIDTFPSDPSAHPLRALIERYSSDHDSLRRFDGLQASPHRTNRLAQFYAEWQQRLHELDFAVLDQDGRVDYLLLKKEIRHRTESLTHNEDRDKAIQTLVPFGTAIVELHEARKRFEQIDSQAVAGQLVELKKQIDDLTSAVEKDELTSEPHIAHRAVRTIEELRRALDRWFRYRAGYDPSFTWWVEKPFKSTDAALEKYGKLVREELVGDESTDGDKIVGEPIGRAALLSELRYEMIPYSPEELIAIGYRELQWCHAELEKAAHELGFGDDWRAALEHVKTLHVEPGKQPELINQLADEAVAFLDKHKLVTIPELCRNSWRMEMMSPESQRVNPYFTGGEVISVSFPTGEMDHQDKLMSMRGNNRHFARATVHHELIPGHHLQLFMADRYRTHRQEFRTPFLVEGWALYWEMLLWDMDFAKSPQDRIGMLFWRSHRCARIIFSLSFHLGTMSSADAIDFLVDNVGHERRNATGEVRRSVIGGYGPLYQAAYMLGGLQLRSLRRQVVDSGKMTSRQFHDAILQENSIPIEMIRAKLTNQSLLPDHETSWRFDPISLIDVE